MIELNDVSIVSQGTRFVERLSLSIQSKSMTLLISADELITKYVPPAICGLIPIDSGRIEIDGVRVPSDVIRTRVVCALERPAMNPLLTPRQNLRYYLELREIEKSVIRNLDTYANRLLLHEFLDRKTSELGRGIVRGFETLLALITQPDYFIQSDFTASFPIPYFKRIPDELSILLKRGSCIVSSTPSFKFACSLADYLPVRAAVLSQKGLIIEGPMNRIIDSLSKDEISLPEPTIGEHRNLEIERAPKALIEI